MSDDNGRRGQIVLRLISAIVALAALGVLIGYAYLAYVEAGSFFSSPFTDIAAPITTALVTVIYVLFTYWLVQETRLSRRETEWAREDAEEAREESRRLRRLAVAPEFALKPIHHYDGMSGVRLKNVGSGPARSVDAVLRYTSDEGEEHEEEVSARTIPSGENIPIEHPFGVTDYLHDLMANGTLEIEGEYVDALGESESFSVVYGESQSPIDSESGRGRDRMRDIANELKKIRQELE